MEESTFPIVDEQLFWYVVEFLVWRKPVQMCQAQWNMRWKSVSVVMMLQVPMLYDSTNSSVGKKHLDPSHKSFIHFEKWQT